MVLPLPLVLFSMARWKESQLWSLLTKLRLAQEVDGDKFKDLNLAHFGEMDERSNVDLSEAEFKDS